MTPQEYGQNVWVCIVKIIDDHETKAAQELGHTRFICSINDDQYKEVMLYNEIINHVANQEDKDIVCIFKHTFAHEGPLNESHTNYKGYSYNMMVNCKQLITPQKPYL